MSNVKFLIPKSSRPVWVPDLEEVSITPIAMAEIPLLGQITAGRPIDICEDNQTVSVPANMVRKNCYALRVKGHSMIDDNIQDGDIIIVEKRESVVALINGEQVTLKKFYVEKTGIRLQPANPDMLPIYLRNEEVQVLGIVTGVIRPADSFL